LLHQNHQGVVVVILHFLLLLWIVVGVVVVGSKKRCNVRVKTLPLLLVTFLRV